MKLTKKEREDDLQKTNLKKIGFFVLFLLFSFPAFLQAEQIAPEPEKRLCFNNPEDVPKATLSGMKYTALNEAFEKTMQDDKGRVLENYVGGDVSAIDLTTGFPKWKVNIYKATNTVGIQYKVKSATQTIEPILESACIVKIEFQDKNKKILVSNKKGDKYLIDLTDKSVKTTGDKKPQVIYE